jgi:tRNA (guanine37-N1)-methyltransferase
VQIDVFTLVPHAFAWMCEQRPVAAVLGGELDLRIYNYRDFTPLRAGQVDDEPYGGGAGMVLRVDVVDAALRAAYRERPSPGRVIALSPSGRQLDQSYVEELAAEPGFAILSARFEGFDARVHRHLATETLSIGPYVLSGGELAAMTVIDAVTRHVPGALGSDQSVLEETFSAELGRGHEYPHYTRPAEYRGWEVPEVLRSGDHARIAEWRRDSSGERSLA